ncbi:MAG: hypothetical protein IKL27_04675 [Oscillospiraceae bacterium]|nr:hypothetical protein [Oscillospiraceae bacterium]
MDEYKKPYLALFNALTDIAEEIEKQNYGLAKQMIADAQRQAEEAFLAAAAGDE